MKSSAKVALLLIMGLTIVSFQNCSKVGVRLQDMSKAQGDADQDFDGVDVPDADNPNHDDDGNVSNPPNGGGDESVAPLDAHCKKLISGSTAIAYDSIAPANSVEKNFAIQIFNQNIDYETVGKVASGAANNISVKARTIGHVGSFASSNVSLNAVAIDEVSGFSAAQVVAVARSIREISSFAAKLCVSVQEMNSLHSLASDMTILGRSEGGVRAKVKEIRNIAAFISLYDVDIESIQSGAIRVRVENSNIGTLRAGSGSLYLVNSKIDTVANFAGTIHLYGNSSVGSNLAPAVRIVQH